MLFIEGVGYVDDTKYVTPKTTNTSNVSNNSFDVVLDTEADKLNQVKTYNLDAIFDEAAAKYNLPKDLLTAVAWCESGFNVNAGSSAGAAGIMQLMPSTCTSYGVTDPYDAYQNIMGGAAVLRDLSRMYDGNLTLTLAAYNAGSGNVQKYGGVPPFTETQNYVNKVLTTMKNGINVPDKTIQTIGMPNVASATSTQTDSTTAGNVSDTQKAAEAKKKADTIAQIQKIMQELLASRGITGSISASGSITFDTGNGSTITAGGNVNLSADKLNSETTNIAESALNLLTGNTDGVSSVMDSGSNMLANLLSNMQELVVTAESLDDLLTFNQYQFLMTHYASMLDIISTLGSASVMLTEQQEDNDSLTDLYRLGNYQINFNKAGLNLRQPL